jgi:hypothetical protein
MPLTGCYNPSLRYKPQWAYPTPPGYRDETFLMPFLFEVPGTGAKIESLPWQLDDDQPYIIRGMVFPQIGLANETMMNPGLCRIRDSHGNPLSDGLILSLGAWCQSGVALGTTVERGLNAFGFPIEPEIECAPGGVLLFDFQISTNAAVASFSKTVAAETITFFAGLFGTAGNAFTIQLIDPGAPNIPLSVAVFVGVQVQVTLATDGASVITSTFTEVRDIVNTLALSGVMLARISGTTPNQVITAQGATPLTGGAVSDEIYLNGCFIGVKRFKGC